MNILIVLAAVLAMGCNGVLPTRPTAYNPADFAPIPPTPPTPPPPGPHFALEIHGSSTVTDREPWIGSVSVVANPSIIRPELPARVITTCGPMTQTHALGSGSAPVRCLLPVGVHAVQAVAEMSDGRRYGTATHVTVQPTPPGTLMLWYRTDRGGAPRQTWHIFETEPRSGVDRFRWSFGDTGVDTTLLPSTTHHYQANGSYRVTVSAVDTDGRIIGTGATVVVIAEH